MFIINPSSIKRKTISVSNCTKEYLMQHGHAPISKDGNAWIYIASYEITSLLEDLTKEGDT